MDENQTPPDTIEVGVYWYEDEDGEEWYGFEDEFVKI